MRILAALVFLAFLPRAAMAAELEPFTGPQLNDVPLAEALGRMSDLGDWQMPSGGWVHLLTLGTKGEIACSSPDTDGTDCRTERLFVSLYDAPTIAMSFTLFRSPEALRWYVPKDARRGTDAAHDFTLPVESCGVTMRRTADGPDYDWYAESWRLHVHEEVNQDEHPSSAFVFRASLEKLATPRHACAM